MLRYYSILSISFIIWCGTSFSQDFITGYRPPKLSSGYSVNIYTNPIYETYSTNDASASLLGALINANATAFRFSDKLSYGGYGNITGLYEQNKFEQHNSIYDEDYKEIVKELTGTLYLTASYYFIPNKFYICSSLNSIFDFVYSYKNGSQIPYFKYENYLNTAWFAAGFGRIYDASQVYRQSNTENIMLLFNKHGLVTNSKTRMLLNEILDKRNYGEYKAKYNDNADIVFFSDLENLLIENKVINGPLSAEAVMKIYQSLTNEKYIYYPMFKGFQVQAELQYLIDGSYQNILYNGQDMDYLTFSGIYGMPINKRFNAIFSGFLSIPTKRYENDFELFYFGLRSPFVNFMPVILQRYFNDNSFYNLFYGGGSGFIQTFDPKFISGFKLGGFYRINSFAGSRFTSEFTIAAKDGAKANYNFGSELAIDFNILSKLRLGFAIAAYRNSQSSYRINTSLQSSFNIF